jgi:hypothetical protein
MKTNRLWIRAAGIAGVLGGLMLFAGDMLFYYHADSTNLKLNMGNVSELRIMLSGLTALFASWFYMLGLVQVYYAFKPSGAKARNAVLLSFGAILIAYGVIHGAYVAIAVASKLAVQHQLEIDTATRLAVKTNQLLRLFVYPAFAVLSIVFIMQVWKKKTLYPRWIILFFPLVPFVFRGLLKKALSGSALVIFDGGFLNLILVIFFLASTVALWNIDDN